MNQFHARFKRLYGDQADHCLRRLAMLVGRYGVGMDVQPLVSRWNQRDAILITYGDMVHRAGEKPLVTLKRFLDSRLAGAFSYVHLLPFFPYSSDDGFSILHYRMVNPELGDWPKVQALGERFYLMMDLVLDHVSRESGWFIDYQAGVAPGRNYFIEMDPQTDLSAVVRPRSSPLLTAAYTRHGLRHVWTTFSADQIDLNFANPDVLFEIMDILLLYVSQGARIIRLDAIAYLWKKVGTSCIHLPEVHEIVKIFRDLLDMAAPQTLLLTETNVQHKDNVAYFGAGDEAHMVYQFALPPLVLHALAFGQARYLTQWAAALSELPAGCTFLNFTASHDGIGVLPLQGLVPEQEIKALLDRCLARDGQVSSRQNSDGSTSAYEMNITFFDVLSSEKDAAPELTADRFLCSQAIPLALRGIPAIYFNSLVAASNDTALVKQTEQIRSINRTKWDEDELTRCLGDTDGYPARVFNELIRRLKLRAEHPAFHPEGPQVIHAIDDRLFVVERTAPAGGEHVLAVHNVAETPVSIPYQAIRSRLSWKPCLDLLAGAPLGDASKDICLQAYQVLWLGE